MQVIYDQLFNIISTRNNGESGAVDAAICSGLFTTEPGLSSLATKLSSVDIPTHVVHVAKSLSRLSPSELFVCEVFRVVCEHLPGKGGIDPRTIASALGYIGASTALKFTSGVTLKEVREGLSFSEERTRAWFMDGKDEEGRARDALRRLNAAYKGTDLILLTDIETLPCKGLQDLLHVCRGICDHLSRLRVCLLVDALCTKKEAFQAIQSSCDSIQTIVPSTAIRDSVVRDWLQGEGFTEEVFESDSVVGVVRALWETRQVPGKATVKALAHWISDHRASDQPFRLASLLLFVFKYHWLSEFCAYLFNNEPLDRLVGESQGLAALVELVKKQITEERVYSGEGLATKEWSWEQIMWKLCWENEALE